MGGVFVIAVGDKQEEGWMCQSSISSEVEKLPYAVNQWLLARVSAEARSPDSTLPGTVYAARSHHQ